MNNYQIDSRTNIDLFIEHKVNFNYKEYGNVYIPIEQISYSLKKVWIKHWYEMPKEIKLTYINQIFKK
jgi:hypothetical protein